MNAMGREANFVVVLDCNDVKITQCKIRPIRHIFNEVKSVFLPTFVRNENSVRSKTKLLFVGVPMLKKVPAT